MGLLAEFGFEIAYFPGKMNVTAHYLFRANEEENALLVSDVALEDYLHQVFHYLSTGSV